jgi:hypothetical protein
MFREWLSIAELETDSVSKLKSYLEVSLSLSRADAMASLITTTSSSSPKQYFSPPPSLDFLIFLIALDSLPTEVLVLIKFVCLVLSCS